MSEQRRSETTPEVQALWRAMLLGQYTPLRWGRALFRRLPSDPRCILCLSPFGGVGGVLMRFMRRRPSPMNPRFCDLCDRKAVQHGGGAEVPVTLLFADVRGSTAIAEQLSLTEYSTLLDRFYQAASRALIEEDALIDKMMGDGVIALFVPGFAGEAHAARALRAAEALLQATGARQRCWCMAACGGRRSHGRRLCRLGRPQGRPLAGHRARGCRQCRGAPVQRRKCGGNRGESAELGSGRAPRPVV